MSKYLNILFLVLFFLVFIPAYAQKTRQQLEKEKKEAIKKMQEAENILKQTEKKRESSLGQLNALNSQITASETIINSINGEISIINEELSELGQVIESLESDLTRLKEEYAHMVYTSYKANFGMRSIVFIFSAPTFNQLFLRAKYMEQYASARKKQLELIQLVRTSLVSQKSGLEESRITKDHLLAQEKSQNNNLVTLRKKQETLINSLSQKETEIRKELDNRKKAIARLDNLIADIVAAEIKASSKGESSDKINLNSSQTAISKSFESSFAKLQWPVAAGFISGKFGTNSHPVYTKLKVANNGIDIQTNENQEVRAVFEGLVKAVAVVPGEMRYVVLIQHGEYFTVYAKLREVIVSKGSIVRANQKIGIVNTDSKGTSELQFQIWKNSQKLNPEN
ncbi:MAG: peptidoglycan DD-metalloendopeptidase family protein, partial [Cyclobacteriaceae bacterium]|nr:peptidoglycan DD-metalloendopeptidase family protein [Cyclobacteriaceae bacterium]